MFFSDKLIIDPFYLDLLRDRYLFLNNHNQYKESKKQKATKELFQWSEHYSPGS